MAVAFGRDLDAALTIGPGGRSRPHAAAACGPSIDTGHRQLPARRCGPPGGWPRPRRFIGQPAQTAVDPGVAPHADGGRAMARRRDWDRLRAGPPRNPSDLGTIRRCQYAPRLVRAPAHGRGPGASRSCRRPPAIAEATLAHRPRHDGPRRRVRLHVAAARPGRPGRRRSRAGRAPHGARVTATATGLVPPYVAAQRDRLRGLIRAARGGRPARVVEADLRSGVAGLEAFGAVGDAARAKEELARWLISQGRSRRGRAPDRPGPGDLRADRRARVAGAHGRRGLGRVLTGPSPRGAAVSRPGGRVRAAPARSRGPGPPRRASR